MSQEFHAIYEHGILRPLTPLNLARVGGGRWYVPGDEWGGKRWDRFSAADLRRQQQALNAMFDDVDKLPQAPCNDGLSGRDHDQILYGSPK